MVPEANSFLLEIFDRIIHLNNNIDIYNKLYNGETLTFDLLKAKPCFKMNDNQTVTNLTTFERSIKATSAI